MDPIVLLKGALPPIAAALLLVSLGGARLLPLAVAVGAFVAFGLLKEWPAWPHELWSRPNAAQWLVWLVVAAAGVAQLEQWRLVPGRVAIALAGVVAALGTWLVLARAASHWPFATALLHVGGGGAAAVLAVLTQRRVLAAAPAGLPAAIAWSVLLSLDAALLTVGRSALFGQLGGATAAALGAAAGTALWRRGFALPAANAAWLGAAHVVFLLAGVHVAYLPWSAALLALPVPFVWLLLPRAWATRPALWTTVAMSIAVVPLAVALWLAETGAG